MIKDYYKTTCPCCGQPLELFINSQGNIALRFYDIEDQAEVVEILKKNNIEFGVNLCGKEDK
jgi:hypothetical protein